MCLCQDVSSEDRREHVGIDCVTFCIKHSPFRGIFLGRIPNESSFGGCLFKLYLIRYSLGKLKCLHFQSIAASAIHSRLEPSGHQGAPLKRQDFIFKKRKMFHPLLDSKRLALVFFISPSSWHRCVLNVLCRTLQQSFPYRNDTT